MKKLLLTLLALLILTELFATGKPEFKYEGSARIQVATSIKGTLTVGELATFAGYEILSRCTAKMIVKKSGVIYSVSKVETNHKGLIVFIAFTEISRTK